MPMFQRIDNQAKQLMIFLCIDFQHADTIVSGLLVFKGAV